MNIGNKIKQLRISAGLTQSQLAGSKITRNMLSCIESGKASPSIDTLSYLADRLNVPVSFLVSEDDNLFFYQKNEIITKAKDLFYHQKYSQCIEALKNIDSPDDEICYILCACYFNVGKASVLKGSLKTAKGMLENSLVYAKRTIYDTEVMSAVATMYLALANNIQSPLLELDQKYVSSIISRNSELDFYNYIIQNSSYDYNLDVWSKHLEAKEMIRNRRYYEAVSELRKIEEQKGTIEYNAYFVFSVYSDIEICYRQLGDFENAYRYASKRLSLLEAFKS